MPLPLIVKAHAKINLFLNLLYPRDDGFHEVRFVMQRLALVDSLTLTPGDSGFTLTCSEPDLASSDNLVSRAYAAFYQASGLEPMGLQVYLEKHIPVQAGLGGGSSDAAAMLSALNILHESPLSLKALQAMGATLGSDVPFFLGSSTALATGRGEVMTPLPSLPVVSVLLVKPRHWGVSTPEAFKWVRFAKNYRPLDFSLWEAALQAPEGVDTIFPLLHNDFEAVVFAHHPQLLEAKQHLLDLGAQGALLSGSGPTLFGLFSAGCPSQPQIDEAFPPDAWWTTLTAFQ